MRALLAACFSLALAGCATSSSSRSEPAAAARATSPPPVATATAASQPRGPTPEATVLPTPTVVPQVAPTPTAEARAPLLDGLLDGVVPDGDDTDYAVVLEDLGSGARVSVNADQALPSASLYKLGVAWAVMRQVDAGMLKADDTVTIEDDDVVEPEPDGGFGAGDTPSVHETVTAMLSVSSNAAAHALLRVIGRDAFTAEMDRIGLHQTRVPDESLATTSAADMAHLLRLIATSPDLSAASHVAIAQAMRNVAPPDALRDTLPDNVGIYEKTGNLPDASNVGGLLETERATAILVVIDTGVDPGDARAIIAQIGQIAYQSLLK
jgi:beta-lactamase class A